MDIREEYIQGNILKIGQILEGNLEIIDRRSNYVVVVDKNGKDYKMFLEEAFERLNDSIEPVLEQKTNKKKTLRQILEGQETEIDYKGYKSRNLKFFDELRSSLKEELSEQTEDPYANLRYLKAVDEMAAFYKKETEEGLTEEEINHLSRIIDRAKKYGHSKQSYKNTPYHDRDIRTTNAKDVEDEHPSHERDGIRLKKFIKQESTLFKDSKTSVRDFLAESVDFDKAEQELNSLEQNKESSEKLINKVDDFEDIAHLYDHDDIHIFEELTEALSREERIRRKIAFSKSKSKRERAKEIALKRLSNKPKLIKKARKAAIELIKEHIARKPLNKLTISEKERLEKMISKRKDLIDRLARKLAPKISQIERNRVYGQHVKEAKDQEEVAANLVDDDFVDVADSDEEEGNDVDKEQKDKAHAYRMRKNFVVEDECCEDMHESLREELIVEEAEYQGKKVKLNKPFRTPGGPKKFAVYTRNDKDNVVKVTFGDPNMSIKSFSPERKKSFRARHNCADPGPKWKANYWSCRMWSSKSVSDILAEEQDVVIDSDWTICDISHHRGV